jgi:hypothetical protein
MSEQYEQQQETLEIIPPDLKSGESVLLYDTRGTDWDVDDELKLGSRPSIFGLGGGNRLTVELVHTPYEQPYESSPNVTYTLLLTGTVRTQTHSLINAPCFICSTSTLQYQGHAIRIGFWNNRFLSDRSLFTDFAKENPLDCLLAAKTYISTLTKFWFTGSFGAFSPSSLGYSPFVHIGIGITSTDYIEDTYHMFEDGTFQLFMPIPLTGSLNQVSQVQCVEPQLGSGDMLTISTLNVHPYQIVGGQRPLLGSYQRKSIPEHTLFLLVHVLSPSSNHEMTAIGEYTKRETQLFRDKLPPFDPSHVIFC